MRHLTGTILALLLAGCAVSTATMGAGPQNAVFVCHGKHHPTWKKVPAQAANGHRRHGDTVSNGPERSGASCSN